MCAVLKSFEVIRLCEINALANWPAADNTAKYMMQAARNLRNSIAVCC
jgi:hypothetical protein